MSNGLIPIGKEVGFPDRRWAPPRPEEEPIEVVEGDPIEEEEEGRFEPLGHEPPIGFKKWAREQEKSQRGIEEEEEEIEELRIKAISLGGDTRYTYSLTSKEALRAYIRRLEEEGFKYEREKWRFGEEKKKSGRERDERVVGRARAAAEYLRPKKGKTDIYFPGAAMRKATMPAGPARPSERVPIAQTGFDYGSLRQAGQLKGMPSPLGDISSLKGGPINLQGLKEPFSQNTTLTSMSQAMQRFPKSWTRPMKFAYQEIVNNHDTDTSENVRKDLAAYQIDSRQVDTALNKLRSLGFIRLVRNTAGGEPEWQITDRLP